MLDSPALLSTKALSLRKMAGYHQGTRSFMLKKIWGNRWYLLAASFTFLIALILTAPLHWVWKYVEPKLPPLPLHIEHVQGTVWHGRFITHHPELKSLGTLQGEWQLRVWPLFLGRAELMFTLKNNDLRLQLPISLHPQALHIEHGSGYFDFRPLQPLLAQQHGHAEGNIQLQQFNAHIKYPELSIEHLSGNLFYSGGKIGLLVNSQPVQSQLPNLFGRLHTTEKRSLLDVTTPEDVPIFSAYLQNDGWGGVEVRRNFIDILGQSWPVSAEPDSIIFEVSRKVL